MIIGFAIIAFIAGSTMTSFAYAVPNGQPFQALWDAIDDLQTQIDGISFVQTDPNEPVLELQIDPNSNAPALIVNDGTNDLFLVNEDGSIQIGSNTVIINPDGTVTGPLHLEAGSTIDGQPISQAEGELTFSRLTDTAANGHVVGWNPDGSKKFFSIAESSVIHTGASMSVIAINVHDLDASILALPVCSVLGVGGVAQGGMSGFNIACTNAPGENSILGYSVLNP